MSRRANKLVIFERKAEEIDLFSGEVQQWKEVTKAYVSLSSDIASQRGETTDADQRTSIRRGIVKTTWTPTMAKIDTACRMKIAKFETVNPDKASDDLNFRIFGIDSLVNVNEQNRELQIGVMERS